jgi:hypothetical protein
MKGKCLVYWTDYGDGREYDCEYPYSGSISCEDCIFGSYNGRFDPRIKSNRRIGKLKLSRHKYYIRKEDV